MLHEIGEFVRIDYPNRGGRTATRFTYLITGRELILGGGEADVLTPVHHEVIPITDSRCPVRSTRGMSSIF